MGAPNFNTIYYLSQLSFQVFRTNLKHRSSKSMKHLPKDTGPLTVFSIAVLTNGHSPVVTGPLTVLSVAVLTTGAESVSVKSSLPTAL